MAGAALIALPDNLDQTRHRLEAFSDIVIALALSQLAFTLRIPVSSHALLAHPVHILTFLASFVFICALWWLHHQLFARYFTPDTPSVILNFAFLAAVVFVAYSLQLVSTFGDTVSLATYSLSIGAAFSLLAILFAKGLRDQRLVLDDDARQRGVQRARRLAIVGVGLLVAAVVAILGGSIKETAVIFVASLAALTVVAVTDRLAQRKRARDLTG